MDKSIDKSIKINKLYTYPTLSKQLEILLHHPHPTQPQWPAFPRSPAAVARRPRRAPPRVSGTARRPPGAARRRRSGAAGPGC